MNSRRTPKAGGAGINPPLIFYEFSAGRGNWSGPKWTLEMEETLMKTYISAEMEETHVETYISAPDGAMTSTRSDQLSTGPGPSSGGAGGAEKTPYLL